MKKNVLISFLLTLMVSFSSFGQEFAKGDVIVNAGVGFWGYRGGYFDHLGSRVTWPQIITSVEFGVHDYISVGPFIGFQTRSFNGWGGVDHFGYRNWTVRETWWSFGGKAAFHFTSFLNEQANTNIPEQLDLYAGIFAGMSIYHKNRIDRISGNEYPENVGGPCFGLLAAGARYFFTPGFGAYLEITPWWVGDLNTISTGFTFRF